MRGAAISFASLHSLLVLFFSRPGPDARPKRKRVNPNTGRAIGIRARAADMGTGSAPGIIQSPALKAGISSATT
jgi:hypothetical protein